MINLIFLWDFVTQVLDIVLRLAWTRLVLAFNLHSAHKLSITTTVFCLEIIRRDIWNFFRYDPNYQLGVLMTWSHLVLGPFVVLLTKTNILSGWRMSTWTMWEKYRAFRSVPLPFRYSDDDGDKDDWSSFRLRTRVGEKFGNFFEI